jgi:ribosome hibernation promoting factor
MRIDIRHSNFPLSGALTDHVERTVGLALRRFAGRVAAIAVRLVDVNGPRGGLDKRCRIVLTLDGGGQLVAQGLSDDAYAAVGRAAERLHGQVARLYGPRPRR